MPIRLRKGCALSWRSMLFSSKKLPGSELGSMRVCPVETVRPYFPMPAPTYVLLSGNEKFISVKAPLDFFTPEELERFRPMGAFFFSEFIDRVLPFRREALSLRSLLQSVAGAEEAPVPYELSDIFVRTAGRLWSEGGVIEPFFVAIFAHELVDPVPGDWLTETYSRSVVDYEQGMLRSGWAVWNAMHLGYLSLPWLKELRDGVFRVASGLTKERSAVRKLLPEMWMRELASTEIPLNGLGLDRMRAAAERSKLFSCNERLRTDLITDRGTFTSIFGPGGFRDG
jgi:hypothetical protein